MVMFVVGLVSWWYGAGLKHRFSQMAAGAAGLYDYFSIDLLARSLFAPYRQISAGAVGGSVQVKFQAFLDRTISRVIGACVRSTMIIAGIVSLAVYSVVSAVLSVVWLIAPFIPLLGVVGMMTGWVPWKM